MGRKPNGQGLSDLQFAINGEEKLEQQELLGGLQPHELGADEPTDRKSTHVIFKLVNSNRKGKLNLHGIDDVINPATKKMERIRCLTGVESLWLKDQKDITKEYVDANLRRFIFVNGSIRLPEWDTQGIEYLKLTRNYVDNPNRKGFSKNEFYEWNPARQAELALQREELVFQAWEAAYELNEVETKKLCLYFGVGFADEMGELKVPKQLKRDLAIKAKSMPEQFLKAVGDPVVEVNWLINRAIRDAKIDLSNGKKAYWANGGFITSIPENKKAIDVLVEIATMPNDDGKAFMENLKRVSV